MNPLIIAYFIINYLRKDQANNSKQQHMQMKLVDSLVDFQKYIGEYISRVVDWILMRHHPFLSVWEDPTLSASVNITHWSRTANSARLKNKSVASEEQDDKFLKLLLI